MYAVSVDKEAGVMVGVYGGINDVDADCASCVASIIASDASAAERGIPHVCVLVTQRDTPIPPPIWRKRMADSNKHFRAQEYHFALVNPKSLHRGTLTAILWLMSPPKAHRYAAFETFADAALWIQRDSRRSYPMLQLLYERALQDLEQRPNS
jgi:hypothetical protein